MTKSAASREAHSRHASRVSFITHKINIDEALAILTEASANHFGVDPDDVTWAHCGDLHRISKALQDLVDAYQHKGEYAKATPTQA